MPVITRFDRLELKFIVPTTVRDALIGPLGDRLARDPYGDANSSYRIATLYCDNEQHDVFWDQVRGVRPRHKLRLRRYGHDVPEIDACFMEVKTRLARRVVKRRVALTMSEALALGAGRPPNRELEPLGQLLVDDMLRMIEARGLKPACLVRYRREAYVGTGDDIGLRVTFDSDLTYRFRNTTDLDDTSIDGPLVGADTLVLEVKVNDAVPLWLSVLLGQAGATVSGFSKYGQAVRHDQGLPLIRPMSNGASSRRDQTG